VSKVLAAVVHGAGDLRVEAVPAGAPGAGEVEVAVGWGGICGTDLHYVHDGRVGDFPVRAPMVLGHEVSGTVARLGDGVRGVEPGQPVAIDPTRPCLVCASCRAGRSNLCTDVRFLGSAARVPHVDGGFRERLVVRADQCLPLPDGLDPGVAVLAEQLAVALHAVARAGRLQGRAVLVCGAGPIGALVAVAARHAGAADVIVTDVLDEPLAVVRRLGATATVNVAAGMAPPATEPGTAPLATEPVMGPPGTTPPSAVPAVDVAVEASGAPAALATALAAVRPGGRVVLLGMGPDPTVPLGANRVVTREVDVVGSFRFGPEFARAVRLLADGLDLGPLVTGRRPFADAVDAFAAAADRRTAMKVLLAISR
jgi:L-idonate 5-dehydrogenase